MNNSNFGKQRNVFILLILFSVFSFSFSSATTIGSKEAIGVYIGEDNTFGLTNTTNYNNYTISNEYQYYYNNFSVNETQISDTDGKITILESWLNSLLIPYNGSIKNIDLNNKNLTTTGNLFSNFLGSFINRINKLFVVNIDASGNATFNSYYGGMWYENETGITATLNASYQKVTRFNNSDAINGFYWFGNSTLELMDDGGVYEVNYRLTSKGENNKHYHSCVFINEVCQFKTKDEVITNAVIDQAELSAGGFIRLNKYDNVTLRTLEISGTSTIIAYDGNLRLKRIGN
jgi:hypothetical protein